MAPPKIKLEKLNLRWKPAEIAIDSDLLEHKMKQSNKKNNNTKY